MIKKIILISIIIIINNCYSAEIENDLKRYKNALKKYNILKKEFKRQQIESISIINKIDNYYFISSILTERFFPHKEGRWIYYDHITDFDPTVINYNKDSIIEIVFSLMNKSFKYRAYRYELNFSKSYLEDVFHYFINEIIKLLVSNAYCALQGLACNNTKLIIDLKDEDSILTETYKAIFILIYKNYLSDIYFYLFMEQQKIKNNNNMIAVDDIYKNYDNESNCLNLLYIINRLKPIIIDQIDNYNELFKQYRIQNTVIQKNIEDNSLVTYIINKILNLFNKKIENHDIKFTQKGINVKKFFKEYIKIGMVKYNNQI